MHLRPSMVELVVDDMAATLAFYRRLGLDIPEGSEDGPHVEVDLGGIKLGFDRTDVILAVDPSWTAPTPGGHRAALAFECDSPDAVDAAWEELVGAGYDGHLPPWDAFWGMRYAVVRDPDGRPVDLYAMLATAET